MGYYELSMSAEPVSDHVHLIDAPFQGVTGVLGTYIVRGERSIIVDPGPTVSIPHVVKAVKKIGVMPNELVGIIPTHIHLDHSGGSWKLMEEYPPTKLVVHPRGTRHMADPSRLEAGARALFEEHVSSYGSIRGVPTERAIESEDGQEIDLGGVTAKIIWTPGHAAHHQCIYVPEDRVLIAGDAAGFYSRETGIIMPTTPPPFNPVKTMDSLDRLIELAPRIVCYGHFGYAGDAVEKLKAHRNQIKAWLNVIQDCWEAGKSLRETYELVRNVDPFAERAGGFSSEPGERSPIINLQGFIQYLEWLKTRK